MRLRLTLALAVVLAPAISAAQGKEFEGLVSFEIYGNDGQVANLDYARKGDLSRIDVSQGGVLMYMIANDKAQSLTMVMPQQNMYMETELPDIQAETGAKSENEPVKTERTDEVAGHSCEIWTMRDEGKSLEVCVAKDMGAFFSGMGARNSAPGWQARLDAKGFFPLRVVDVSESSPRTVLEATKIEVKTLEESFFAPPAGAQKMNMPGGAGGGV
jgi:hypothetical protein